jgi:hypothetical protein
VSSIPAVKADEIVKDCRARDGRPHLRKLTSVSPMLLAQGPSMRAAVILLAAIACCGCTHHQLARSMVNQASTVTTIEYQMVLDNIAMFTYNPAVLPWAIRINDGTVQVNDEGGIPELGAQWGATPGMTRALRAVRSVTEQWGAHPVTDPLVVKTLQDVYRQAIGIPPMPDPPFLEQLSVGADAPRAAEPTPVDDVASAAAPTAAAAALLPYEGSPLARLRHKIEVPVGWFYVGHKCDVPDDACFVGHYCDNYVWVTPNHFDDLSHFTLIVLGITKHGVASQPPRGLDYVRR